MTRRPRHLMAAIAAALAGLPAQSTATATAVTATAEPQNASTRLHQAWLREVLDLDVAGAIEDYQAIAKDRRPADPQRWIAVGRLAELKRLGLTVGSDSSLQEAPASLRDRLPTGVEELSAEVLMQRLRSAPTQVLQPAGTNSEPFPLLRPFTWVTRDWVQDQIGLSPYERQLQRALQSNLRQRGRPATSRSTERSLTQAFDILRVELQRNTQQADKLRAIYFRDWQPPTWQEPPAVVLERVRANIAKWTTEPDVPRQHLVLLQQLQQSIDQRASEDPADSLALLARIPLLAERLLGAAAKH